MADVLGYAGAGLIIGWGIAHIIPTAGVVAGFGPLSETNRRIVLMEWVAEGLALVFLGALVLTVTVMGDPGETLRVGVFRLSAAMLLVMAAWTALTGARTSIVPIKVCPFVKAAVAGAWLAASFL